MKILQINTSVNTGSTGRIAEEIGLTLLQQGHESHIAYGRGFRPSKSATIRIGKKADMYLHGLRTILLDDHGFGSAGATRQLVEKIREIKPDVIGLHNIHGYYLNIRVLFEFLKTTGIPVVWTLHDCWSFTGHCSYFDDIQCEKWKTHCAQCPKTRKYPSSLLVDNSIQNFDRKKALFTGLKDVHIVVPSDWLGGLVAESFLSGYPVKTIHNGVDTQIFRPLGDGLRSELGLGSKRIVLGCASIWDKRKGLADLMELSRLLPEDHQVIAIGVTDKQIAAMPPGMMGVKRTESVEQLAAYYSMADVFVNPTYQDNFPTTNIEALACGTPVITYLTGGSPEAIDAQTGIGVAKGDINGLVSAITATVKKEKEAFSAACRQRAVEHFNKNRQYAIYLQLYENIKAMSL